VDKKYMDMAFDMAMVAYNNGEIPIGAVIVKDDKVIASAYNKKECMNCALFHAELLAIERASNYIGNWRLDGCDIYVTLDPCPMCASAIKQARISNVYSALSNSDIHNHEIISNIFLTDKVNSSVCLVSNLDVIRSRNILKSFFEERRKR